MAARVPSPSGEAWKRYIFHFANHHLDFKLPELMSIASTVGCPIQIDTKDAKMCESKCESSPFLEVRLKSDEDGKKLMRRSTLGRSLFELLAEGRTLADLCKQLSALPNSHKTVPAESSFRFQVECFNKRLHQAKKLERIHTLLECCPAIVGRVDLKNPEHSFTLLEYYGPEGTKSPDQPQWLYFGRWIADGQRDKITEYHLQKRHFIGNTSMDAALSLIMANMGAVKSNHVVYDPFVGSGSILVACASFGAYVAGSDINYLLLHAKARPSRHNQKTREKDESIRANLKQYGLESRYLDVFVADSSKHNMWRDQTLFDAIITDPPYGIRESSQKIAAEPCDIPEGMEHYPKRVAYNLTHSFLDLLNFAAHYLRVKGRLVYWLPVYPKRYNDNMIPQHKCLRLVANSEQAFNSHIARRLITMEKTAEWQDSEGAFVKEDPYKDQTFRESYFNPEAGNNFADILKPLRDNL